MADMINVADFPLKVAIAMGPGAKAMITEVKPGEVRDFPDGYCKPVRGAGAAMLPCILSRKYTHHGVPVLVPVDQEDVARERYQRTKAAKENASNDPQAQIRRLEAELAQARAEARAVKTAPAAKAPEASEPASGADELEDATTPKPAPKRKRTRKAKE